MGFPKKFIHLYQPCPVPSCKISSKNIFTKWKRCSIIATAPGALAQLARVPHWQCGSHRFESDMLHQAGTKQTALSLFLWASARPSHRRPLPVQTPEWTRHMPRAPPGSITARQPFFAWPGRRQPPRPEARFRSRLFGRPPAATSP